MVSKLFYAAMLWLSTFLPHRTMSWYPNMSFEYQTYRYGTVIEQTYEGSSIGADDAYIIELQDGTLVEVVSDDLQAGDDVTVYYNNGNIIWVLYGER